jgi:hypothetical protein
VSSRRIIFTSTHTYLPLSRQRPRYHSISPDSLQIDIMGFSLFKKKNKDKTAPPSPSVPASPNQRLSVPTNTMKGAYSPSLAGSPRPAGSPRVAGTPSYLNSPALSVNEWGQTPSMTNGRRIKLRCVLDPLPNTAGNMQQDVNSRGEALKELFYISAELDAPIDTLRRDITHELGVQGKFSVGVYKVGVLAIMPFCFEPNSSQHVTGLHPLGSTLPIKNLFTPICITSALVGAFPIVQSGRSAAAQRVLQHPAHHPASCKERRRRPNCSE